MKADPHFLSIDNGTQSLRALIFDSKGTLIARKRVPFVPYVSPKPGWAEQDTDVYWQALRKACQGLWEKPEVDKERLVSVAVTTQRGTVVNLDRNGKPLRPAITWLDQRVTVGQKPIGGLWGLLFKIARVSDTVAYLQANAESNWLRTHQPEVWKQTEKFVLLSGYLNYMLTGQYKDSIGSQVGYLPFDYKHLCWASRREWKWDALGIPPEMLPELVAPGHKLGEITPEAAVQTGIPQGLPVLAAAADKACEVLGSGSLEPDIGNISYGTTATVNTINPKYIEAVPFIPPYPGPAPDTYSIEVQIFRGYWMVEWFKSQFGYKETEMARMERLEAEQLLEQLICDIPPGCDGLILQPYWSPGIKIPGPEARGAVLGFTDVHSRGHLYRAILEGLAFALREGKERIERRSKTPISSLRVSGGGSQSDTALQITADIFGLPAARPHTYETSGLGAAVIQAVGSGYYNNYRDAVGHMTHTARVFEPVSANQRLYDQLYKEVYLPMYGRLQPLYKALKRIMG